MGRTWLGREEEEMPFGGGESARMNQGAVRDKKGNTFGKWLAMNRPNRTATSEALYRIMGDKAAKQCIGSDLETP